MFIQYGRSERDFFRFFAGTANVAYSQFILAKKQHFGGGFTLLFPFFKFVPSIVVFFQIIK